MGDAAGQDAEAFQLLDVQHLSFEGTVLFFGLWRAVMLRKEKTRPTVRPSTRCGREYRSNTRPSFKWMTAACSLSLASAA